MYKRYHIESSPVKLENKTPKFQIIRDERCLNCGKCADWCIYDVHNRDTEDLRKMADPVSSFCKNCFTCIQNCPRQALTMVLNDEYENLGDSYWTPQIISTIWNEAEEGKIPVYGAGYRGPFRGSGFDDIWTDMSEIVRPTRDGIHGREYIATAVDIGRKLACLTNFERLTLPNSYEIQVPVLLNTNPLGINSKNIIFSIVKAAEELGTFALLDIENYFDDLKPHLKSIALRFPLEKILSMDSPLWEEAIFIEVLLPSKFSIAELKSTLEKLKKKNRDVVISLMTKDPSLMKGIIRIFRDGMADVLNFNTNHNGKSHIGNTFISEAMREIHSAFVKERIRDEMTIIGRGGIAAAEHVPKLIICGADAVVLDVSLLVAMGCRVCSVCQPEFCPIEIEEIDQDFAGQRITNMICAWRDQLLEVLGAMGIRDVRRIRGEVGRAMFYEKIEKESFKFIFKEEVPSE